MNRSSRRTSLSLSNWQHRPTSRFAMTITLLLGVFAHQAYSPSAASAAARVGTGGTNSCVSCTSLAVTIPSTAAGDTLILVAGTNDAAAGGVTAVSGGGCTWAKATAASGVNGGGPSDHAIWYCPNTTAGQTTVTLTIGTWDTSAVVQEYSGVLTASPLDKTAINNTAAQGTALSSGTTAATAQANELLIGGFTVGGNATFNTPGGTNGAWTLNLSRSATNVSTAMTDNTANSAATSSATLTSSASNWWVGSIATFLPAVASGNLSVGNGATVANANAQQGSANNAIDSFTAYLSSGTGQINTLVLTTSAQFTAANVANISVYNDAGTLGAYNAGVDTLVSGVTYTVGTNSATLTFSTPLSVTTTTANYLITLDIQATATTTNTLTARVTGGTGSGLGTPTYNDSASATLTITAPVCTRANPTVTLTPASQNVAPGGSINYTIQVTNNDSSQLACGSTTFSLSSTDLPATPNANFNASTLPASIGPINAGGSFLTATLTVSAPAGATNGQSETTSVTTAADANHTAVTSNSVTSTVATGPVMTTATPAGNRILYSVLAAAMVLAAVMNGRRGRKNRSA